MSESPVPEETPDAARFPTDPITLMMLREACSCDNDDGRSHLFEFLDFGTEIDEETELDPGDPDLPGMAGARVVSTTYKPGRAPWSPQGVIIALCDEIERLRGAD